MRKESRRRRLEYLNENTGTEIMCVSHYHEKPQFLLVPPSVSNVEKYAREHGWIYSYLQWYCPVCQVCAALEESK